MVNENLEAAPGAASRFSDSGLFEKIFPTLAGMRYPAKKSKPERAKIKMSGFIAVSLIDSPAAKIL